MATVANVASVADLADVVCVATVANANARKCQCHRNTILNRTIPLKMVNQFMRRATNNIYILTITAKPTTTINTAMIPGWV